MLRLNCTYNVTNGAIKDVLVCHKQDGVINFKSALAGVTGLKEVQQKIM